MGRRTVRWNKLNLVPGQSSCSKCMSMGMIQEHDYITGKTLYYYCDCYFGQQERAKEEKRNQGDSRGTN